MTKTNEAKKAMKTNKAEAPRLTAVPETEPRGRADDDDQIGAAADAMERTGNPWDRLSAQAVYLTRDVGNGCPPGECLRIALSAALDVLSLRHGGADCREARAVRDFVMAAAGVVGLMHERDE